jgi:hypothetical protein
MGKHSAPLARSPIDLLVIDRAATLTACQTGADIACWMAAEFGDLAQGSPYAAGFGAAQTLITELLAIIEWQAARVAALEKVTEGMADRYLEDMPLTHVPMVCTNCGQPVMEYSPGNWMHKNPSHTWSCHPRLGPVKARVDA